MKIVEAMNTEKARQTAEGLDLVGAGTAIQRPQYIKMITEYLLRQYPEW